MYSEYMFLEACIRTQPALNIFFIVINSSCLLPITSPESIVTLVCIPLLVLVMWAGIHALRREIRPLAIACILFMLLNIAYLVARAVLMTLCVDSDVHELGEEVFNFIRIHLWASAITSIVLLLGMVRQMTRCFQNFDRGMRNKSRAGRGVGGDVGRGGKGGMCALHALA